MTYRFILEIPAVGESLPDKEVVVVTDSGKFEALREGGIVEESGVLVFVTETLWEGVALEV